MGLSGVGWGRVGIVGRVRVWSGGRWRSSVGGAHSGISTRLVWGRVAVGVMRCYGRAGGGRAGEGLGWGLDTDASTACPSLLQQRPVHPNPCPCPDTEVPSTNRPPPSTPPHHSQPRRIPSRYAAPRRAHYPTAPYHIHPTRPHRITSHPTQPHHTASHRTLTCHTTARLVTLHRAIPHHTESTVTIQSDQADPSYTPTCWRAFINLPPSSTSISKWTFE